MPDLLPILADFLATAQGAYPDLDVTAGSSCVLLRWGSHTLTAWVDVKDGDGTITITLDCESRNRAAEEEPLDTVASLIAGWIDEQGHEPGEGPDDAEPDTFAARVWVAYNQAIIDEAQAKIARLDPEGRYSVQSREDRFPLLTVNLADFNNALDNDTRF